MPHRLGAEWPELADAVVLTGSIPRLRPIDRGESDALFGSESVVEGALKMARTDYRTVVRMVIAAANPQMSETEIAERVDAQVAYCPWDVALERAEPVLFDDTLPRIGPALGSRLWMIQWESGVPLETVETARELLPEAYIVEAEAGPITRPDITAGVIREITADARARAAPEPG